MSFQLFFEYFHSLLTEETLHVAFNFFCFIHYTNDKNHNNDEDDDKRTRAVPQGIIIIVIMDGTIRQHAEENPDRIPTMAELVGVDWDYDVQGSKMERTSLHDAITWLSSAKPKDAAVVSITELLRHQHIDGHDRAITNVRNARGRTPVHTLMCKINSFNQEAILTVLDTLIRHGADPNLQAADGTTALHNLVSHNLAYTVRKNDGKAVLAVLDRLLEYGVDPNLQAADGTTALHTLVYNAVCTSNREEILMTLDRLLKYGGNPNLVNAHGKAVLHILMNQMIYSYSQGGILAVLDRLLENGSDPNLVDSEGKAALHIIMNLTNSSCNQGPFLPVLTRLLEYGADPNLQAADGTTVLHILMNQTVYSFTREAILAVLVKLLVYGANPDLQDNIGQTALHRLAKSRSIRVQPKLDILTTLLEHVAFSALIPDNDGNLPLSFLGDPKAFDPTMAFLLIRQMFHEGFK